MIQSRPMRVGPAPVDAARISYAGELGWELTTEPSSGRSTVWDRLRAAGTDLGLEPFGYRALDSLRMEKGYRYFGTDLTMLDTPFEAGLGAFVRLDKGHSSAATRCACAREAARRTVSVASGPLLIGGADWLPDLRRRSRPARRRGRRPPAQRRLRADRRAHDRVRLPARRRSAEGAPLEVDVFDERVAGDRRRRRPRRPGRRPDARAEAAQAATARSQASKSGPSRPPTRAPSVPRPSPRSRSRSSRCAPGSRPTASSRRRT